MPSNLQYKNFVMKDINCCVLRLECVLDFQLVLLPTRVCVCVCVCACVCACGDSFPKSYSYSYYFNDLYPRVVFVLRNFQEYIAGLQ